MIRFIRPFVFSAASARIEERRRAAVKADLPTPSRLDLTYDPPTS